MPRHQLRMKRGLLVAAFGGMLAMPLAAAARTAAVPVLMDSVQGTLYAKSSPQTDPLFVFVRTAEAQGSTIRARLRYDYVDGRPAVREQVTYDGGRLASYAEHNLQNGSRGEARIERSGGKLAVHFSFTPGGAHASARHNVEYIAADDGEVIVDDNLVPFMLRHWDALKQGEKVDFRYVVVSRTETVACDLKKVGTTVWHGEPAVDIAMAPSGFFAGMLVDPVHFIVQQAAPHHVLAYRGRTMPKVRHDGSWKSLDAVTVFEWKPQNLAGPAEAAERYDGPRTAVGAQHPGRSG